MVYVWTSDAGVMDSHMTWILDSNNCWHELWATHSAHAIANCTKHQAAPVLGQAVSGHGLVGWWIAQKQCAPRHASRSIHPACCHLPHKGCNAMSPEISTLTFAETLMWWYMTALMGSGAGALAGEAANMRRYAGILSWPWRKRFSACVTHYGGGVSADHVL